MSRRLSTWHSLCVRRCTKLGGTYSHPATQYTLEFPQGPLAIASTVINRHDTVERDPGQLLHVLTRTDTVCLCLSKFYFWNDRSSLVSALAVAATGEIDLAYIVKWSTAEGVDLYKLTEFRDRYQHGPINASLRARRSHTRPSPR